MQISAHPIAAGPAAPVAQAGARSSVQGGESPFAKLLSAQPQPQDAPKPADADTRSDTTEADDDKAPDRAPPATRPGKAAKPGAAAGAAAREGGPRVDALPQAIEEAPEAGTTTPADPAGPLEGDAKAADGGTVSMDPALAQWLATLNRPVAPVAAPATGTAPGGAIESAAVALDAKAVKGQPPQTIVDTADARSSKAAERKSLGLELPAPGGASTPDTALIAALDERKSAQQPTVPSAAADPSAIGALAATSAAGAPTRTDAAAAPLSVSLPTPVTSPEFKGALGMQVSVLARDGIQHAELHLNPAEMGPISVQIALDGTAAQVDFGADSATTRRIIEAGLPELASALRDAGLTLSGGGVSQHSRGQPQGDGAPNPRGGSPRVGGSEDTGPQAARRVNLRLPLGAVDLYA